MAQPKPTPELFEFDEMTEDERSKIWVGHRCNYEGRLFVLNIPRLFADAKLSDFNSTFREYEGRPVFITGEGGKGKTHFLAALAKRQLTLGATAKTEYDGQTQREILFARFINVVDLLAEFRATMNYQSGVTEQDLFSDYATCKHLYLDDLGVQKETDWVSQTLYRIIDSRYANMLPTSISSNLSLDEIAATNSRIARRILETCTVIELK